MLRKNCKCECVCFSLKKIKNIHSDSGVLLHLEFDRRLLEENVAKLEQIINEKKNQLDEANIRNESLERKCTRLRDYIAKLTKKCEEWSESCRKQSKELRGKKIDKNDLVGQVQVLSSEMKNICEVRRGTYSKKLDKPVTSLT